MWDFLASNMTRHSKQASKEKLWIVSMVLTTQTPKKWFQNCGEKQKRNSEVKLKMKVKTHKPSSPFKCASSEMVEAVSLSVFYRYTAAGKTIKRAAEGGNLRLWLWKERGKRKLRHYLPPVVLELRGVVSVLDGENGWTLLWPEWVWILGRGFIGLLSAGEDDELAEDWGTSSTGDLRIPEPRWGERQLQTSDDSRFERCT